MVDTYGTGKIAEEKITELVRDALQADAARHHRGARPAPADLQEDGGVRPLRPHRRRVLLGKDRPRERITQGRGPVSDRRVRTLRSFVTNGGGRSGRRFSFCRCFLCRHARWPCPSRASSSTTVRGSFHIHTNRSDGSGSPDAVAAAAARAGLQFIVLTDHGDGTRKADAPQYREGVLVIDAVEISTQAGHYIAIGIPQAPYPLRGDGRDVVEDVRRLGGFGIVAHPDSAKPGLRWHDWNAEFDGLEWLNADTEWRDERSIQLARALARYRFRPAETLASLLDRPDTRFSGGTRSRRSAASWRLRARTRMRARDGWTTTRRGTSGDGLCRFRRTTRHSIRSPFAWRWSERSTRDASADAAQIVAALKKRRRLLGDRRHRASGHPRIFGDRGGRCDRTGRRLHRGHHAADIHGAHERNDRRRRSSSARTATS